MNVYRVAGPEGRCIQAKRPGKHTPLPTSLMSSQRPDTQIMAISSQGPCLARSPLLRRLEEGTVRKDPSLGRAFFIEKQNELP